MNYNLLIIVLTISVIIICNWQCLGDASSGNAAVQFSPF